jgi:yeast amino acid transporter
LFKIDEKLLNTFIRRAGIPIAVYSFVGVEIVAVTALEAKDPPKSLKWPAKSVATILTCVYLFSVLSFYLNVSWEDDSLPSMFSRSTRDATLGKSIIMIATTNSGIPVAPGFLNVCLIGAVFSAANTTLYVASRTLFGIAKGLDPRNEDSWLERKFSCFGATNPDSKVPQRAVMLSVACGVWLAWVHVGSNFNDQWVRNSLIQFLSGLNKLTINKLQQIMSGIATNSIILVWASQCWAFINYRKGYDIAEKVYIFEYLIFCSLDLHSEKLTAGFAYLENTQLNSGPLSHLQPSLAWAGLVGCLVTIFFGTAGWWQLAKPSASDILATWTVVSQHFVDSACANWS